MKCFALFHFSVICSGGPSTLMYAWCWLQRGEVWVQEKVINTRNIPLRDWHTHIHTHTYTHLSPSLPLSLLYPSSYFVGPSFPSSSLRNDQLMLFILSSHLLLMLLFRRDIFSDVEVASCVLRRLLCTRLSAVRGWVCKRGETGRRWYRTCSGVVRQWFPIGGGWSGIYLWGLSWYKEEENFFWGSWGKN